MKINNVAFFSLFSLLSGSLARRGSRFRGFSDDNEPIAEKSRVTAFINTEHGLKVQCWEIGSFLPDVEITRDDGSKGRVRKQIFEENVALSLFTFAPSVDIFKFGTSGVHTNAIDFRAKPNLFTVKDGLIFIEASGLDGNGLEKAGSGDHSYVFADVNGDDWFYFEDTTSGSSVEKNCAKSAGHSHFNVRTISGSDTTLINFEYQETPHHEVLHEGRCNFAGLKPVSQSGLNEADSGKIQFRNQEF